MKLNVQNVEDAINAVVQIGSAFYPAIGIFGNALTAIEAIAARGTPPTQAELHQIALDARAEFDALPKPDA